MSGNYSFIINLVHYYLLRHYPFDQICGKLKLKEEELIDCIEIINQNNNQKIPVLRIDGKYKIIYNKTDYTIHNLKHIKNKLQLLVVSDKHFDHTDDRINYIDEVYNEAVKRGVDYIFDLGDILNGPKSKVRKPDKVKTGTLKGSIRQLKKYHPDSIPTYFITGNHDLKFMEYDNCDIGRLIESECKNMIFLNNLFTPVDINGLRINLSHGSIENKHIADININKEYKFLNYNKPHIICQGHFHVSDCKDNDVPLLYQIPCLKSGNSGYNIEGKGNTGCDTGAVFLTINELKNEYEVEHEKMEFIEPKKIIKKELRLKKTINY